MSDKPQELFITKIVNIHDVVVELFTESKDAMRFARDHASDLHWKKIPNVSGTLGYWKDPHSKVDDDAPRFIEVERATVDSCAD